MKIKVNELKILIKENIINLLEQEQELDLGSEFSSFASNLKSSINDIEKEISNSQVNEAVGSLIISILLSSPKLMELLGKLINNISKKFNSTSNPGDTLIKTGHHLEHKYLKFLKQLIKLTGADKKAGIKSDKELEKSAKLLLYVILGSAAISAGSASIDAVAGFLAGKGISAALYGATKGGLAGLKSAEVIHGIKNIKKVL